MNGTKQRPIAFKWHGKLDDFVTSVAWSPDGERLAAGSASGQVAIYDVGEGRATHLFEQATRTVATPWRGVA
jgi:WD40 repeat protein